MVDYQMHRHQRIDLFGVTAERSHRIAHRRQIDDAGNTGKILHQHARGPILYLARRSRVLLPVDQRLQILDRDGHTIFEAQQVFEQHFHAEWQARYITQLRCGLFQTVIAYRLSRGVERRASGECILSDGGHGSESLGLATMFPRIP